MKNTSLNVTIVFVSLGLLLLQTDSLRAATLVYAPTAPQPGPAARAADRDGLPPTPIEVKGTGRATNREWLTLRYMLDDAMGSNAGTQAFKSWLDLNKDGWIDVRDLNVFTAECPIGMTSTDIKAARSADQDRNGKVSDLEAIILLAKIRFSYGCSRYKQDPCYSGIADLNSNYVIDSPDFYAVQVLGPFAFPMSSSSLYTLIHAVDDVDGNYLTTDGDYQLTITEISKFLADIRSIVEGAMDFDPWHDLDLNHTVDNNDEAIYMGFVAFVERNQIVQSAS